MVALFLVKLPLLLFILLNLICTNRKVSNSGKIALADH